MTPAAVYTQEQIARLVRINWWFGVITGGEVVATVFIFYIKGWLPWWVTLFVSWL